MNLIERFPEGVRGLAFISAAVAFLCLVDGKFGCHMLDFPDDGDGGSAWLRDQLLSFSPPHYGYRIISVSPALQVNIFTLVSRHHSVSLHHEAWRSWNISPVKPGCVSQPGAWLAVSQSAYHLSSNWQFLKLTLQHHCSHHTCTLPGLRAPPARWPVSRSRWSECPLFVLPVQWQCRYSSVRLLKQNKISNFQPLSPSLSLSPLNLQLTTRYQMEIFISQRL